MLEVCESDISKALNHAIAHNQGPCINELISRTVCDDESGCWVEVATSKHKLVAVRQLVKFCKQLPRAQLYASTAREHECAEIIRVEIERRENVK